MFSLVLIQIFEQLNVNVIITRLYKTQFYNILYLINKHFVRQVVDIVILVCLQTTKKYLKISITFPTKMIFIFINYWHVM